MTGTPCAIVGIGETEVARRSDLTSVELGLKAAIAAIRDAGLRNSDIDGVITQQTRANPQANASPLLSQRLGIQPAYVNDISLSGGAPSAMVANAVAAISAGLCSVVLCASGGGDQPLSREGRGRGRLSTGWEDFMNPFGAAAAPVSYALGARRHMHAYGTTSEQFGAVAVACRKHAQLNANAVMRKPMTLEDHQSSRLLADPYRLLDCCVPATGAGAVIVTTAERARDLKQRSVEVAGIGQSSIFATLEHAQALETSAARGAAERAFAMAGLTPAEIDMAQLYDPFTSVVLVTLEDYGFCAKGEGGAFVEGGRIELGGQLPVNTHGGLLSQGHLGGIAHVTEAVRQLRHQADERQVAKARTAVVSSQCAQLGMHVSLILTNERVH
ncbi:thiolase family protein [Brevundimonas guildfordensis]|uniref:Thiolase family protein n=1 Tax=Brevundimonas guildfordensis TaxID=2762241 RepID=A0ABR8QWQ0_9CAUL|nr:thiolase family protein [Brevundimonas guildfordensis]MBD7939965.1 thiolase family protein [Brevundimonas guildfordensis]